MFFYKFKFWKLNQCQHFSLDLEHNKKEIVQKKLSLLLFIISIDEGIRVLFTCYINISFVLYKCIICVYLIGSEL